jgi:hypothetical protein
MCNDMLLLLLLLRTTSASPLDPLGNASSPPPPSSLDATLPMSLTGSRWMMGVLLSLFFLVVVVVA